MDRVPERLLQGGDLGAQARRVPPAVLGREHDVAGKRAITVDAKDAHVLTEVEEAALALAAGVVDDVGFRGDERPGLDVRHAVANRDDPTGHLVAEDPRRTNVLPGPVVPIVDVHVGAANGRRRHFDQDVFDARLRDRDLLEAGAR